ncbi:MAG: CAP domain-containing protein [Myxococcota bacterium]
MPEPRVRTVAALLAGLAISLWCTADPLAALAQSRSERAVLERVNALRIEHHLQALRSDAELARVALAHAREMADEGYLDHIDRAGRNPLQRAQAAGIGDVVLLAENIAASNVAQSRLDAVLRSWLQSHSHRENLLNPAFDETGIGIADAPDGTRIYVELFATRER